MNIVIGRTLVLLCLAAPVLQAEVPQLINYQGRVAVGTVNFEGAGQFKFALVDADGTTTYWSNDGTSTAGSEPTAAVTLAVTRGLYSVLLGDTALPNMTAIPNAVFNNTDVRLRVWFNDGMNGSQQLAPDQRIAAVAYAIMAGNVLAEIKRALGDDTARFAATMARPILVERELRRRFDNDDNLHAAQRHKAELARENLLAKQPVKEMREVTWQLTPRPVARHSDVETNVPGATDSTFESRATSPTQAKASSRAYTVDATAQLSQTLTPSGKSAPRKEELYFDDLDPELQKVLRVQLQKPGDVSAVIETPGGFLVFQATDKNAVTLTAASLSIPKRSYEEWLAQQPAEKP